LKFCPKCGSVLLPKKENEKVIYACACGYSEKVAKNDSNSIKETVSQKEINITEEIEVNSLEDEECPKCGHSRAYFWEIQTRASDEPATKFFKCEKCKHIWRDYK
jgi:DNA-directed RNA polymerase subunit M